MDKDVEFDREDLGLASSVTKGPPGGMLEPHGFMLQTGIADND